MNDLGWFFSRFRFQDLCDSFPKDHRIDLGFNPLDMLRYRYHGKLNMNINCLEINFFKERNFKRFDPKFRITVSQVEFFQQVNYLEWVIKNINISKVPSKQFETQILKIPLIETILRFQYNNAEINNHYRDRQCHTIKEYLKNIEKYSTKDIAIEFLLHIPSLRNNDHLNDTNTNELLSYFIKKAKVPVFHFQKTYMRMIYDFICEYVFKKDYSVKTEPPKYQIDFNLSAKALVSDLISIFSDFDYNSMSMDDDKIDIYSPNRLGQTGYNNLGTCILCKI